MRWLITVLLLLAAACGTPTAGEDGDGATTLQRGDVDILTQSGTPQGFGAALGTFDLQYDPDLNCLYVDQPDNNGEPGTGGRVVIHWPTGYTATFDGVEATVFDEDGDAVAVTGVPFQLGGGGGAYDGEHCDAIGVWVAGSAPQRLPSG